LLSEAVVVIVCPTYVNCSELGLSESVPGEAVGVALGDGVGVGTGVAVGVGDGLGVSVGEAVGVGVGEAVGVAVAVGAIVGVGVGVGVGLGVTGDDVAGEPDDPPPPWPAAAMPSNPAPPRIPKSSPVFGPDPPEGGGVPASWADGFVVHCAVPKPTGGVNGTSGGGKPNVGGGGTTTA
jgi:hypothetical protein